MGAWRGARAGTRTSPSSAPAWPGWSRARDLEAGGASVVLLEARDRVGGRTLNHDIGDGKVVEVGGQWIGPTQDRLAALARELGGDTFPTYAGGGNLLEDGGGGPPDPGAVPPPKPARARPGPQAP